MGNIKEKGIEILKRYVKDKVGCFFITTGRKEWVQGTKVPFHYLSGIAPKMKLF